MAEAKAPTPCRNFAQNGECRFGDKCRFHHIAADGTIVYAPPAQAPREPSGVKVPCRNWLQYGNCQFGASCRYCGGVDPRTGAEGAAKLSPPAQAPSVPVEYQTYLDEKTGHQRLKGGALLIRDPTEEEKAAHEAQSKSP